MKMDILVVDDDEVLRGELSEWLIREGHEVKSAESGDVALEMVKSHDFSLILTDLKMPGMNGIDVLKAVKKLRPTTHMVMITAYGTIDTAVEAMKIGADDYICKPFEMEQLQSALENVARTVEFEKQIKDVEEAEKLISKDPFELFKSAVRDKIGLCITQQNPETIKKRYELHNVSMLWLTPDESGDSYLHPKKLYDLNQHIEFFIKKNPEGVVLLDGLEALINQHPWETVKNFILRVSSEALREQSSMIISIQPGKIEESILAELKHLITNPYIQLISESLTNLTRRNIVRYLTHHGSSRFTDILNGLKLDSAPKLSFHLLKMLNDGILQKEDEKRYSLTNRGKSVTEYLAMLEDEATGDVRNNISLILISKAK